VIEFYAIATRLLADNGLGLTVDENAREIRNLKRILKLHPNSLAIFTEWEQLDSALSGDEEAGARHAPCGRDEGSCSYTF
jgi:2-polyprenyl-6-methoxyphenol hydroxylase-like FAD-dependent oxidoreductase